MSTPPLAPHIHSSTVVDTIRRLRAQIGAREAQVVLLVELLPDDRLDKLPPLLADSRLVQTAIKRRKAVGA